MYAPAKETKKKKEKNVVLIVCAIEVDAASRGDENISGRDCEGVETRDLKKKLQ